MITASYMIRLGILIPTFPFIRYLLQVILACYTEFEERDGLMNENGNGRTAYDIVKKLTEEGLILREGSGRNTFYVRAEIERQ